MPAFHAFIHPWSMRIDPNLETVRLRSDSDTMFRWFREREGAGRYLYVACWIWSANQSVSHWMALRPVLSTVSCV